MNNFMRLFNKIILFLTLVFSVGMFSQETLPIYSDYLSDNVYLIHPSAAGVGNCGKIRVTGRNQWMGIEDAPSLLTLTAHQRIGNNVGVGLILFNDRNGYHSQQGVQGTFAYHIDLDMRENANQLSFGLSFTAVNNSLDISDFDISEEPVFNEFLASSGYFNVDFGMSYHNKGFFSYITVKNIIENEKKMYNANYEPLNMRKYVGTLGYYFGEKKEFQFEPSVMAVYNEYDESKFIDVNLKAYKKISEGQFWVAFSFRQGLNEESTQNIKYFTPIIGLNYRNFMFAFTYTKQTGDILFDDAGYNQISLGYNFGCRTPRQNGCPNMNYSF